MAKNPKVLFLWVMEDPYGDVVTHVKLAWNLDDEFREEFGKVHPDDSGDEPDYGLLLPEYENFKVCIDSNALARLV